MPAITCPNCERQFGVRIPVHNCMRVQRKDREKRQMKLFLLQVWSDVEPQVFGPYGNEASRRRAAKRLRNGGEHGVFRIDGDVKPDVRCFSNGELEGAQ